MRTAAVALVVLGLGATPQAQDYAMFPRTRALTTNTEGRPELLDVLLLVARDGTLIVKHRETQTVYFQMTPQSVQSLSVEVSSVTGDWGLEDAYWLLIAYQDAGAARNELILRLDRREVDAFVQAAQQRTGRSVDLLLDRPGPVVPTKGSEDIDRIVDYPIGQVEGALEGAMTRYQCRLDGGPTAVEGGRTSTCRRPEASAGVSPTGPGNEEVTVLLQGVDTGRTRVIVTTDRGTQILARNRMKQNWSTPLFEELVRRLGGGDAAPQAPSTALARAVRTASIRQAFDADSEVVAQLVPGEIVEVLDEREDSYLVRPPDGDRSRGWQTGWIPKTAVALIREPAAAQAWPDLRDGPGASRRTG